MLIILPNVGIDYKTYMDLSQPCCIGLGGTFTGLEPLLPLMDFNINRAIQHWKCLLSWRKFTYSWFLLVLKPYWFALLLSIFCLRCYDKVPHEFRSRVTLITCDILVYGILSGIRCSFYYISPYTITALRLPLPPFIWIFH